ncbi:hypothetical protein ACWCOP_06465 [Maricaulaceae bacterium MS644]
MIERVLAIFCALMSAIGMQVLVGDLFGSGLPALAGFIAQIGLSFYVLRDKIGPNRVD